MASLKDYLRWALGGVTQPDYPLSPQNFWPKAASAAGSIKPLQPSPEGNKGPLDYLRWAGGGMTQPDYPLNPQNFWPAAGRAAGRGLGIIPTSPFGGGSSTGNGASGGWETTPFEPNRSDNPSAFTPAPQLPPTPLGMFPSWQQEGMTSVPTHGPGAWSLPQDQQVPVPEWNLDVSPSLPRPTPITEEPTAPTPNGRNPYDQNFMSYYNPEMQARRDAADARRRDNMRPATGDPYLLYLKKTGLTPGQAMQVSASSRYGMPGRPDYGVPPPDVTSLFDPNAAMSQTMAGVLPMQTVLQGAASMYGPALQETARAHGAIGVAGPQGAAHIAAPPQYYPETSPIGSAVGSRFGTAPQPPVPALTPEHMQWAVEKGYVSREEYVAWLRSQMAGMRQGANIPQGFQSRPAGRSTAPRPAPQR